MNYWVSEGDGVYSSQSSTITTPTLFVTYEANSSFSNSETQISFGDGEGWRTSCVANRRAFIANVTRKDRNTMGSIRTYGDRIYYSPPNRFDTFPSLNYIDIGINDGDEIINLSQFGDRLFAFKKNTLYIINISQANDTAWFLEEQYLGYGVEHPYSVFQSQIGIAWANKNGAFLFDGNSIIDLTEGKIDNTQWSITDKMNNCIVGYYPKGNLLYFSPVNSTKNIIASDYVFSLKTKQWCKSNNTVYALLTYLDIDGVVLDKNMIYYTNYSIDHYGQMVNAYNYELSYSDETIVDSTENYSEVDTGTVVK